jgi:hypothetical protein
MTDKPNGICQTCRAKMCVIKTNAEIDAGCRDKYRDAYNFLQAIAKTAAPDKDLDNDYPRVLQCENWVGSRACQSR